MTVPMGSVAPPRPRRRPRDLEYAAIGFLGVLTAIVVTALQARWVAESDDIARSAASLVLVLPPLALLVFGLVLVVMAWRRRPFRGFWTTELRSDHARRGLLLASLVLTVVELALLIRLVGEIVAAVERST